MKLTYTNVNGYLIPNLIYKSGEQMEQLDLIKIYELVARYYNEPDIIKIVHDNFRDVLSK